MIPFEKQACNLKPARRLKELGVTQEAYLNWIPSGDTNAWCDAEGSDHAVILLFFEPVLIVVRYTSVRFVSLYPKIDRTLTQCRIRVPEEGRDGRHQAGESGTRLCLKKGTTCGVLRRGIAGHGKPCPGEKQSEQGFGTRHLCIAPPLRKSVKDTIMSFKRKFFMGQ